MRVGGSGGFWLKFFSGALRLAPCGLLPPMLVRTCWQVRYHLVRSGRTAAPLCAKRGVRGGRVLREPPCRMKLAAFEPRALGIDTFNSLAGSLDFRLAANLDRRK